MSNKQIWPVAIALAVIGGTFVFVSQHPTVYDGFLASAHSSSESGVQIEFWVDPSKEPQIGNQYSAFKPPLSGRTDEATSSMFLVIDCADCAVIEVSHYVTQARSTQHRSLIVLFRSKPDEAMQSKLTKYQLPWRIISEAEAEAINAQFTPRGYLANSKMTLLEFQSPKESLQAFVSRSIQ